MSNTPDQARLTLRPSVPGDLEAIAQIYAWHAEHGTGTFELVGPDVNEMRRRRDDVLTKSLPWLVAERGGQVVGYAYANHFRPRLAYRFAVEDSVYVTPAAQGQGIGRLLLAELIARCEASGARQMFAVIGDSANAASVGVHRELGFTDVGVMRAAGWKFERWLDVVILQRRLGLGEHSPPVDAPRAD
jgi:phosphinothricin acetyltransferase